MKLNDPRYAFAVHAVIAAAAVSLAVWGGRMAGFDFRWFIGSVNWLFWFGRELLFDKGGDNSSGPRPDPRLWRWTWQKHAEWIAPTISGMVCALII